MKLKPETVNLTYIWGFNQTIKLKPLQVSSVSLYVSSLVIRPYAGHPEIHSAIIPDMSTRCTLLLDGPGMSPFSAHTAADPFEFQISTQMTHETLTDPQKANRN